MARWSASWEVYKEWIRTGDCVMCVWIKSNSITVPIVGYGTRDGDMLFMRRGRHINCENFLFGVELTPTRKPDAKDPEATTPAVDRLVPWADVQEIRFYNPAVWKPWLDAD